MFLLDTNVVSELRKASSGRADRGVTDWAASVSVPELFISVVTLQELELGVSLTERLDAKQGRVLRRWLDADVVTAFAGRTLSVSETVARRAAHLHVPDPVPLADSFIAATAIVHDLTVVTRNEADFESLEVEVINPWTT